MILNYSSWSQLFESELYHTQIFWHNRRTLKEETWSTSKFKLDRSDGPAHVEYFPKGSPSRERWCLDGKLSRRDGPAFTAYYPSGQPKIEEWWIDGKRLRLDGPSFIEYYENGHLQRESYYIDKELHRDDGPAEIHYYENGKIKLELWYTHSTIHRLGGPSRIRYSKDGVIESKLWAYQGVHYSSEFEYYSTAPFTEEEFNQILSKENSPEVSAALYRNPNFPGDPDEWILSGW